MKKELHLKQVFGARLTRIRNSIMIEGVVFLLIAYTLSWLIIYFSLPYFNQALASGITFIDLISLPLLSFFYLFLFITVILVSFFVSLRFKGVAQNSCTQTWKFNRGFGNLLLTVQYTVSIAILLATIAMVKQMNYVKTTPLGFNRNMVEIKLPFGQEPSKLPLLRNELSKSSQWTDVTLCSGNPISGNWMILLDLDNEESYSPYLLSGDENMIETFGFELLQGDPELKSGKYINQALLRKFNIADPIGQVIPGTDDVITGVVKDFKMISFSAEIPPTIITEKEDEFNSIMISYDPQKLSLVLPELEVPWQKIFPQEAFRYQLINDELEKKHAQDFFLLKIIVFFTAIGLILNCFGLFAFSWAILKKRTQEIGIRKVVGASGLDILRLFLQDIFKWVVISALVGVPIAYYFANDWLQNYVFKISFGFEIIMLGLISMSLMILITISSSVVKSLQINPVEELRSE